MTEAEKYNLILSELAEVLERKNHKITVQQWEIDSLTKKIEKAEAEIEELKKQNKIVRV